MKTVTMYHGTSDKNADAICEAGFTTPYVYLTTSYDIALDRFADSEEGIIEIEISADELLIDFDLGTDSTLMTVEDANEYADHDGWTISDWLKKYKSFAVTREVANSNF